MSACGLYIVFRFRMRRAVGELFSCHPLTTRKTVCKNMVNYMDGQRTSSAKPSENNPLTTNIVPGGNSRIILAAIFSATLITGTLILAGGYGAGWSRRRYVISTAHEPGPDYPRPPCHRCPYDSCWSEDVQYLLSGCLLADRCLFASCPGLQYTKMPAPSVAVQLGDAERVDVDA